MCGLMSIKGLFQRGALPAVAMATLILLAAISTPVPAQVPRYECKFCEKAVVSTPVKAQELRPFNAFGNFQGGVSVGAAAGQTINILIQAADASGNSLNKPSKGSDVIVGTGFSGAHVKVFNAATGALLWSRELTDLTPGLNIFAINRDELQQLVNSDSGRIQFWIEVVIVTRQTRQGPASVNVFAPRFEVFDNQNGRTTINGGIWKTTNFLTPGPAGTTPIVFTGLE